MNISADLADNLLIAYRELFSAVEDGVVTERLSELRAKFRSIHSQINGGDCKYQVYEHPVCGSDPDCSISIKTANAQVAIKAYIEAAEGRTDISDWGTVILDLLTDVMLYCMDNGLDCKGMLRTASFHSESEWCSYVDYCVFQNDVDYLLTDMGVNSEKSVHDGFWIVAFNSCLTPSQAVQEYLK